MLMYLVLYKHPLQIRVQLMQQYQYLSEESVVVDSCQQHGQRDGQVECVESKSAKTESTNLFLFSYVTDKCNSISTLAKRASSLIPASSMASAMGRQNVQKVNMLKPNQQILFLFSYVTDKCNSISTLAKRASSWIPASSMASAMGRQNVQKAVLYTTMLTQVSMLKREKST